MQSGAQRPRDPGGLTGGRWSFRSAGRWFARLLASYQCWMLGGVGCTWGIPGAIGAKFANPDKTVIGFTGDGGSMYTIQALWTAARHNLDVKFVICNNGSYRLLQVNIEAYWKERQCAAHDYPLCFDLSQPPIHFVGLAEAMGVKGARIEKPEQIGAALDKALSHRGPFLLDVVLEGIVRPEMIGMRCGQ